MIFNHEDGNWKNSEVARTMLEILANNAGSVTADEVAPADESHSGAESDALVAEAREELKSFHRTGASHLIINELNRIAEAVGDNPRTALEIEMTIEDIKELFK